MDGNAIKQLIDGLSPGGVLTLVPGAIPNAPRIDASSSTMYTIALSVGCESIVGALAALPLIMAANSQWIKPRYDVAESLVLGMAA